MGGARDVLSNEDLRIIHESAVTAGLADSRDALLAGLDRALLASLPRETNLGAQILSDLHWLASAELQEPGESALVVWLRNAVLLAGPRIEADAFTEALARLMTRRRSSDDRQDRFFTQVERITRLRRSSATLVERQAPPPFAGILEITIHEGPILVLELVGALEQPISAETLELFILVDASYRRKTPALVTRLIHTGPAAPVELAQSAYRAGIRLVSLTEYQGLIDFGRYLEWQTRRLEADLIYPPSLYVEQPALVSIGGREETATGHALRTLGELLDSPHPRFALVLGDSGAGKTFLLHELARRMAVEKHPVVPVLVEMRTLEKHRSLNALIAQHFAGADVGSVDTAAFRYMLAEGRIALLFDGFDELALRLTYDRALEHFDTLLQAAEVNAKVVVSSRTQHFLTDGQIKRALAEQAEKLPGYRLIKIQPFGPPQIRQFLVNRLNDERDADARFALLDEVNDLLGLSRVPRMLGFIADIDPKKLEEAKVEAGEITSAKLYEVLINQWLDGEHARVNPKGAPRGIPRESLRVAATEIAMLLWSRSERVLSEEELATIPVPGAQSMDASVLAHQLGSGSLLVRDEEGSFSFLHQSVLEWLVADAAAKQLGVGADPAALSVAAMSDLMADFFAALARPDKAHMWASRVLHAVESGHAKENALRVIRRLARWQANKSVEKNDVEVTEGVNLAGQDLRGQDLSGADLRKANLSGADLRGATLVRARLNGATITGAWLSRADLQEADLRGADLRDTDLSYARLLGADLREAMLTGTNLRAAKLVGARMDPIPPRGAAYLQLVGAAPPAGHRAEPMILPASACYSVAWSLNGDTVATSHKNGAVVLWDAMTGQALRSFVGHTGAALSVCFSPDGTTLASGSDDRTVRLWEVATGRCVHCFCNHVGAVIAVAFSPHGTTLASGSEDRTVHLCDVASGRVVRSLDGHRRTVSSVAFSPDGATLASGSFDNTVRLWEVVSGVLLRSFDGHVLPVYSVAFSPDGRTIASGSDDNSVRVWDVATGTSQRSFNGHIRSVRSVTFSPDGKTIASGSDDKSVLLWDVASGRWPCSLDGHTDSIHSVAFSPDGASLASGSSDDCARLWNVATGRPLRSLTGHALPIQSVTFRSDGRTLAAGAYDGSVTLWNVATGWPFRFVSDRVFAGESLALSPDEKTVALGSHDATIQLWNVDTGSSLGPLAGHDLAVRCVEFSRDGRLLASGSSDKSLRLWDVATGKFLRSLRGHAHWVQSVAFSANGAMLASGSSDRTAKLWDVATGRLLYSCAGHVEAVQCVAFSYSGDILASGSEDCLVNLWWIGGTQLLGSLAGHTKSVQSIAFSPNGSTLASGSVDKSVRLWNYYTGHFLRVLEGHTHSVQSVVFSPDGRTLASSSLDGIRLWDVATGRNLAVLFLAREGWIAFTPDGRYKLGGDIAGSFWHVIGLCRFAPGELDPYLPGSLRIPDDEPLYTR